MVFNCQSVLLLQTPEWDIKHFIENWLLMIFKILYQLFFWRVPDLVRKTGSLIMLKQDLSCFKACLTFISISRTNFDYRIFCKDVCRYFWVEILDCFLQRSSIYMMWILLSNTLHLPNRKILHMKTNWLRLSWNMIYPVRHIGTF